MRMHPKSGYLEVSELHKIYYEVHGNIKGDPILYIHGGPGAGFSEKAKRFFDLERHLVILFDQRGASKSIPFGSIEENTTQHLVNDITKLLNLLKVDKVTLFGGSWGTTLSLIFAIQYPNRINRLLLIGLFLGDKKSIDYYLDGGIKDKYPLIWERFKKLVPTTSKYSISEYYLEKMINGSDEEKKLFCYEWAFYEMSIFKKNIKPKEVETLLNQMSYESLSILEAHYLSNASFIEEGYIIKNINKLKDIPIKIVHGKYDDICPLKFAVSFDEKASNSKLYITNAGHSDSELETEQKLIELLKTNVW